MGCDILFYGIIYVDYFYGLVLCVRLFSEDEVNIVYEKEIGSVIIEEFECWNLDLMVVFGIIVCNYGLFIWGKDLV